MRDIDIGLVKFDHVHRLFRECTPRLLVVTDGGLSAGPGSFGVSRFVQTLQNTTIHGMAPTVVTRARTTNSPDDAFDDLAINRFDVVFLFGINGEFDALSAPALTRVKHFMQNGGGLFATGDHEDLGAGMCGEIPRVRAMRYWAQAETPDASDASRLSTNLAGANRIFEFDDQADSRPQRLYANFAIPSDYLVLQPFPPVPAAKVRQPHPIVRMADGSALDAYPDHPHEGECRLPDDFTTTFELDGNDVAEWPNQFFFGRPRPRAVASTMSFGNGFGSPQSGKDPLVPRAFISIAAYNGQAANVGRVVTDATWHHYVNVNLDGMFVLGLPNADLQRIQQFWSNLANWLMPATTRRCLRPWLVLEVLRSHPLAEEIRIPVDRDLELDELRVIGQAMLVATSHQPGGAVDDLLADVVSAIVEPERVTETDDARIGEAVVDAAAAVIGSYVVEVARAAAAGTLEHADDAFTRTVERLAQPIVDRVLDEHRAALKRHTSGLETLGDSIRRRTLAAV